LTERIPAATLRAIDREANIRCGLAVIHAGARQIVLLATLGGLESGYFTEFSDVKEQGFGTIGDACRTARIAFVVIRPTAFFSDLTNWAFPPGRQPVFLAKVGGSAKIFAG
jgi:hypothetical protein